MVLCALVLHVARQLELQTKCSENGEQCTVGDVRTIFFLMDKEYPEMLAFMRSFAHRFQLNVAELKCGFKEGLAELVNGRGSKESLPMKAMFTGTRRDDPNGRHQQAFCPTDPSWPPLMRVNPILEYKYHDIWLFLRVFDLPYCQMYDRGYTSIGTTDDTTTNEILWSPLLRRYFPPWRLPIGDHERLGRGLKRFLTVPAHPHLLAYPIEILRLITCRLNLRDLIRLHAAGSSHLNAKLRTGGAETVVHLEKDCSQPAQRTRISLSLEAKFGNISSLSLSFGPSSPGMRSFRPVTEGITTLELDLTKELPKSLTSLVLRHPCSAYPSSTSTELDQAMSSSTEITSQLSGVLSEDAAINLPELVSLEITHNRTNTAPFSLNRIKCPNLTSLKVNPFPIDSAWLSKLSKLTHLDQGRTSPDLPEFPSTLQSLSISHFFFLGLGSISRLPSKLTSVYFSVHTTLIKDLFASLPLTLTNLRIDCPYIDSYSAVQRLPPTLVSLELSSQLTGDFWDRNASYSSNYAAWISSLPPTLTLLYLGTLGALPFDVTWGENLRVLRLSSTINSPQQLKQLPSGLLACNLQGLRNTAPIKEIAPLLPSLLTSLRSFPLDFYNLPDLPQTLTELHGEEIIPIQPQPFPALETLKRLPESITRLEISQGRLGMVGIYTLPSQLRFLVLHSEEGLEDTKFELLPRGLLSLTVFNRNLQTYGDGLSKLPPYLTRLTLSTFTLALDLDVLKREILPITIQHLSLVNSSSRS